MLTLMRKAICLISPNPTWLNLRWQRQLEQNPKNITLMRELYRLASKYNLQPLQEKLQKAYPNQFNQKDMMWFEHGKTITSSKNATTPTQQEKSFEEFDRTFGQN